jgi:hypothetical protein
MELYIHSHVSLKGMHREQFVSPLLNVMKSITLFFNYYTRKERQKAVLTDAPQECKMNKIK